MLCLVLRLSTIDGRTCTKPADYHNDFFNCKNVDQKKLERERGEEVLNQTESRACSRSDPHNERT